MTIPASSRCVLFQRRLRMPFLTVLAVTLLACETYGPLRADDAAKPPNAPPEGRPVEQAGDSTPTGPDRTETAADSSPYTRHWTTSRITGSPLPPAPYVTQPVFPSLKFHQPVVLTSVPGSERLWVAELEGKVYSFLPNAAGEAPIQADLVADLKQHVPGLRHVYGLTCSPNFARDRWCYVCYVLEENQPEGTRVSRFQITRDDPPRLEAGTEQVLISWWSGGHNGGCLKFGPDGHLYISTGDGGPAFPPDPRNSGQDISNLLSSILRIDVSQSSERARYRIPPDNPFVDRPDARGEVWCYGLRNPWKMSFDPATGDLWVGDVGWELWEMVYRVERGANYGWSLVEGPQPVHRERSRGPTPIVPPTVAHSHVEARSVTGGHVYRAPRLEELHGAYVYGDYVTGKIWGVRHDGRRVTWKRELADAPFQIICFGSDHDGELFVVSYNDGSIHRLVENPAGAVNREFPRRLSETGLFASVPEARPAAGVLPYAINAEPWEDGATAERYVALPGGRPLEVYQSSNVQIGYIQGTWKFPPDGVLVKTRGIAMRAGDPDSLRRVETQVLHFDGDMWRGYTYVWNEEQTDATLAPAEGADLSFQIEDPAAPGGRREQSWRIASRSECLLCHTTRAGTVHAFHAEQLRRPVLRGGQRVDQLRWFDNLGIFAEPPPESPHRMADPHDEAVGLEDRARSYLHVNCAHCHRRGGGGTAAIDVRYELPTERTNLFSRPTQGNFGIPGAGIVVPGDPYRSVLLYRMAKLGPGRMPHFGSERVDTHGLELLKRWIASLPSDQAEPLASSQAAEAERRRIASQLEAWRQAGSSQDLANISPRNDPPLLQSTAGALALLLELDRLPLPPQSRQTLLKQAASHEDARIADLFQRFVPPEQRTRRLGTNVDERRILQLEGDVERGRNLFLQGAGLQCRNCHQVAGEGHPLGPDLSDVGRRLKPAQILQSILAPSREIDPKFATYLVETRRGQLLTGLLERRDEQQVTLRDANRREVVIPREDIELIAPQQTSLMPELLVRDLTAQQLADLLAFLASCREPVPEQGERREQ